MLWYILAGQSTINGTCSNQVRIIKIGKKVEELKKEDPSEHEWWEAGKKLAVPTPHSSKASYSLPLKMHKVSCVKPPRNVRAIHCDNISKFFFIINIAI